MKDKICLVTGATAGIGRVTARELAGMEARVVLVGRSPEKTERVTQEIQRKTGNDNISYLLADLSVMEQVRNLAAEVKSKFDRLDVLVNNAGAIFMSRKESADGIEMTFALNHLNYFLLTDLLLDVLKSSAPARIVNVSSGAHYYGRLRFDDLEYRQRRYSAYDVYSDSKLANVMFTYELARRLEGSGVTANVLHPGFVATNFAYTNNNNPLMWLARRVMNLWAISEEEGAETMVYLATSPDVEGVNGKYFEKCREKRSSRFSLIEADQQRLWDISAEMTG